MIFMMGCMIKGPMLGLVVFCMAVVLLFVRMSNFRALEMGFCFDLSVRWQVAP